MDQSRVSRNDSCPCGSGKKYKQCCMSKEHEGRSPRTTASITDLQGKPKKRPGYPIGTVALYGPDDRNTTKIAAGVITGLVAAPFGFVDWLAIPSGTRAKRIGDAKGIDERKAAKVMKEEDVGRADYLKRFYGIERELPTQFDLVVNTDTLTPGKAAEIVVVAAT